MQLNRSFKNEHAGGAKLQFGSMRLNAVQNRVGDNRVTGWPFADRGAVMISFVRSLLRG